jgi:pimeloyl-ACP methyl ester carboxylesterase
MPRFLLCIVATAVSVATAASVSAAPLDILPGNSVRSDPPVPRYAQYDARKAAYRPQGQRLQSVSLSTPKVYLLRGFLNIFSLGMDDLAERINADGIPATVTNHADADMLVGQIVASYQAGDRGPVILVGHSLGADAVIAMAQALDRYNIPVALLVLFDGTGPHEVPGNVARAINFTQRFDLTPGVDFHGTLSNVDLSRSEGIDHFTIDKSPALQASTLSSVVSAATSVPVASARRP